MPRRRHRNLLGVGCAVLMALTAVDACGLCDEDLAASAGPEDPMVVIGGGFSGLTAALELKRLGHEHVVILEKKDALGGRAYRFEAPGGFKFDAGPSWYWMPEIFEHVAKRFGHSIDEYYNLTLLDPAYRVYHTENGKVTKTDIPGTEEGFLEWARGRVAGDNGSGERALGHFMKEAEEIYRQGIFEWIWKPMLSVYEFLDFQLMRAAFKYNMFGGLEAHIKSFVKDDFLQMILKWPVIFLGASPAEAPAMYSLMTHAGHSLGTWYPKEGGGMVAPIQALIAMAKEAGVEIRPGHPVDSVTTNADRSINEVCGPWGCQRVKGVVNSADYHWFEQTVLPENLRRYDAAYWSKQAMSPSCYLYYLGFNERVPGLEHHTFFFDVDLDSHLDDTFTHHTHSPDPTFYVSATSLTEDDVAPAGGETIFVLVPVSYKLNGTDTPDMKQQVLDKVLDRMESVIGKDLRKSLEYQKIYGPQEFIEEFGAFRGNAFGLANVLTQSLILKPSIDSVSPNLVFAGHLTNPGPGVPPSMVSGIVAAGALDAKLAQSGSSGDSTWMYVKYAAIAIFGLIAVAHLIVCAGICILPRWRSYFLCVDLLRKHGRTYFAAATLMDPVRFLDTAALYGLFRVADDYVDTLESNEVRGKNLEKFIKLFWQILKNEENLSVSELYALHPIFPAVRESCLRRKYPDALFHSFFRSMLMDVHDTKCKTYEETLDYMIGSAAVIGDFMVEVLMGDRPDAEKAKALPHARDLGNAFQLTNFLRDIGEDLELNRWYIPEEVWKKYGVDIRKRDSEQPRFKEMMEDMFARTDAFYKSADKGIDMLPIEVRDVIKVARESYCRIHDKIREADYNVFGSKRIKVKFSEKLKIVLEYIPMATVLRIASTEMYFWALYTISGWLIPTALVAATYAVCSVLRMPGVTYLNFHCMFTIPQVLLFWAAAYYLLERKRFAWFAGFSTLWVTVANLYSIPWDSFLIRNAVWGYPEDVVLGTFLDIPYEELAYFSLQTLLVCGLWAVLNYTVDRRCGLLTPPKSRPDSPAFILGIGFLLALMAFSCWLCTTTQGFYFGLILVWCTPIFIVQWWFGSDVLLAHKGVWLQPALTSFAYLCVTDNWAIGHGIWAINPELSVAQLAVARNLPGEEALFFLVTSLMCSIGLTMSMIVANTVDTLNVSFCSAVCSVYQWGDIEASDDEDHSAPAGNGGDSKASGSQSVLGRGYTCVAALVVVASLRDYAPTPFGDGKTIPIRTQLIVLSTLAAFVCVPYLLYCRTSTACLVALAKFLVAAACAASVWVVAPVAAVIGATVAAIYTTGASLIDDQDKSGRLKYALKAFVNGGVVLGAVANFPYELAIILGPLVDDAGFSTVMSVLEDIRAAHLVAVIAHLGLHATKIHKARSQLAILECIALNALFALVPPVLAATIYINVLTLS